MNKKLVLLVEDDQFTGENMKALLELEDFEVILATNTPDSFKAFDLNKDKLTAIILDGSMEKTSGNTTIPLIEYIKAQGFGGYILAASSSPVMRMEMMVAGCNDHCPKAHFLTHLKMAKI